MLNKVRNPNPNSEEQNEIRLKQEALNDEAAQDRSAYAIDTREIFYELRNKWKKYDIDFLSNEVREALEEAHRYKQIASYYDDGTEHMKSKIKGHVESILKGEKGINDFCIPYYYIGGKKYHNYYIIAYDEPCIIRREDDITCFDILFAMQFSLTPINECSNFLKYHLKESFKNNISEFSEFMDNICLEYKEFLSEKHEPFYRGFLKNITEEEKPTQKNSQVKKLKWLGTPSQFSYLFLELAKQGFIEIPSTNGEASYSRYAKVCWDLIDFKKTTQENLKKEMNPEKNTLSESVRAKFSIPSLTDISKKKK